MFRRYRTFGCLTMACFGTLLMCASPALAASRGELPTPQPLWNAFPLNPTGERLVKATTRPFVPPNTEALEAFVPTSDTDPGRILRPTLLVLLLIALVRLGVRRPRLPKANDDGSDRPFALSIVGAIVAGEALYGYAIYSLVVLLL